MFTTWTWVWLTTGEVIVKIHDLFILKLELTSMIIYKNLRPFYLLKWKLTSQKLFLLSYV